MKKMLSLLLAIFLTLALTACGGDTTPTPEENNDPENGQTEPNGNETDPGNDEIETATPVLSADYASEELLAQPDSFDLFTATDMEDPVMVVFNTTATVQDFKVLSITPDDTELGESVTFQVTEDLYAAASLSPDRPLVVGMIFVGDIPNMGVSYTTADGAVHSFTIGMSGKDGSLILTPFET